ncbi:type 2 isopentenyl-diphosphate Delta-isomerase [Aedoeadaptatus ivorii]|uniref:type 2 isopentenyl-diphosphate Delta-isomerase n=1 Tax=Aedoeadaptatus ivorii TaxID=54006 RepID=UPI0027D8683B|nr:type 2 isopentenyl-diphosphate Delta-isomerase [Peptoniphilus ivorii]
MHVRKYRKREHVENYLRAEHQGDPLFGDIFLPHISLPEVNIGEIDTTTRYLGREVPFPLMINAMTGGTDFTEDINADLSELARRFALPMAVGSETIALEDPSAEESFRIVRRNIGEAGIVLANLNGNLRVEDARRAVDLIDADALQIHLNPAQELAMSEGDRDFRGITERIARVTEALEVPVMVKEVGFGMDASVIESLYAIGVRYVDISGFGGTNFFEVEDMRCSTVDMTDLYDWGIPTAYALYNAVALQKEGLHITASGGIRSSLDVVKALVLGADMVGISGEILKYLIHGGLDYASVYLEDLLYKVRVLMVLVGAKDIQELREVPWRATGRLLELMR